MRLVREPNAAPRSNEWCPVCRSDEYGTGTTEDGDSYVCEGCGVVTGEMIFGDDALDGHMCVDGKESYAQGVITSPPKHSTKRSRQNYERHLAHADNSHTYVINDDRFLFGEAFDAIYANTYKTHYNIYNNGKRAADSEIIDRDLHTSNFWKVLLFINHTAKVERSRGKSDLEQIALRDFRRLLPLCDGRLVTEHRSCDLLQTMARYNLCSVLGDVGETNGELGGMEHLVMLPVTVCAGSNSPLKELGIANLVVQEAETKWRKLKQKLAVEERSTAHRISSSNPLKRKKCSRAAFECGVERTLSGNQPGKDVRVYHKRLNIAKRAWIAILKRCMEKTCATAFNDLSAFVTAAYGDAVNRKQWTTAARSFGGVFSVLEQHLE